MTPFEVNFPGIPFMMSFPERDGTSNPTGQKQSIVTKTYSTSSRTVQTFSDGKLVQKQTFQEDSADTVLGSHFKDNDQAMSYNTGSRSTNQYRTLTQGGAKGLVTTGSRVEFKSGNESYNTQVGKDVKTSSNQFETKTEDDFRYFNEIPTAFSQIKLDDQDRKFCIPSGNQVVSIKKVPNSESKSLFERRTPTYDMGCIHSRTETISAVPSKDKTKKDTKVSPAKQKKELEDSALKAHNRYRAKHGVPTLKMSKDLCEMAQKWADHLASIKTLKHSPCKLNGESVGENVAYKWTSDGEVLTGQNATDNWYDEIKSYNFDQGGMSSGTGHFTQVVWKGSKELGIGRGCAEDGSYFVVANYRPAGNVLGKFEDNVFRPKK
ncbi:protein PRY1 isoform X2 [Octopus vulgaris]|nr:protein PRY1 isoform X2 [Octopus vulgaris]